MKKLMMAVAGVIIGTAVLSAQPPQGGRGPRGFGGPGGPGGPGGRRGGFGGGFEMGDL